MARNETVGAEKCGFEPWKIIEKCDFESKDYNSNKVEMQSGERSKKVNRRREKIKPGQKLICSGSVCKWA